jgi:outer membrane putative beta-barrel porin/alpha-amylase
MCPASIGTCGRNKTVQQRLIGIVLTAAIASMAWAGAAPAQSFPAGESVAKDRGPKTLLEGILGSSDNDRVKERSDEEEHLDADRPHFPEASTTVGKGRAILESGYTFTKKGDSFVSHSGPEALLRVGMFADWFEFRVGQNFLHQRQTVAGAATTASGAQDLYLGVKLGLTEQRGWLPATVVIPQMTVPTGNGEVTARRVLPGVNLDFGWEVMKDFFNIELLIANNLIQDDLGTSSHHELATGLTAAFQLTKKLEFFAEWDAFYPTGGVGSAAPRNYAVAGLVYFVTPDFQLDMRAGVGLNHASNDFLTGVGFAARY